MSNKPTQAEIKEARYRLWYEGDLSWKLDPTQETIYQFFHTVTEKTIVVNCSRRLGKSYMLAIMAIEQCLKKPRSIVKMLQPEQKMLRMNIIPIMDEILIDCPDDIRPEFKTKDNIFKFANGSQIQLAGTDGGQHESLRGGNSHLCIIDEAGFCSQLNYIINSILIPTTTLTRGRIILSSTTPPIPDHEFNKYMEQATLNGTLIRKTIDDAVEDSKHETEPRITAEIVADIEKSMPGGRASPEFRTEYLCEVITNSDRAVLPEFGDVKIDVVVEWPRPIFYDTYVSMDIGFRDLTFILFAYYDFDHAVLVIEDEIVISGPKMTTDYLAELIKKKEAELWTNKMTGEVMTPYKRVSDNNPIVLNDLLKLHTLFFNATAKDNKDAQVNQTRMMITARQIVIHPRCKHLVVHMEKATWNKNRTEFDRSGDNGHYDGVDALLYLVRNLDKNRSPYPKGYAHSQLGRASDLFYNPHYKPIKAQSLDKLMDTYKVKSNYAKFRKKST